MIERFLDLGCRLVINVVVCHAPLDAIALGIAILRRKGGKTGSLHSLLDRRPRSPVRSRSYIN